MNASMSRRDLALFLATLLAVTWAVQIAGIARLGSLDGPGAAPYLIVSMFLPALWSFGWLWRRPALRREVAWRLGRPRALAFWLAGALIPAAIALVAVAVMDLAGWGNSRFFSLSAAGAEVASGPWKLGLGTQSWPVFVANFALTGLVFALINSSVAVGEELGWRGLLQHQMIARFGALRGVALLGLVWAFWHLPANLSGYNFPEHPLFGAFVLFPLQLVAGSFVMAWLTRRAGSFWPAVLYHGSGNGILAGVAVASIVPTGGRLATDLAVVAAEMVAGALAGWALAREARRAAERTNAVAEREERLAA